MATVYINDKTIDIGDEKLNLIQAAERAGVYIPRYCWHPALSVVASCRMCLVEVGTKAEDGSARMMPKVVPACQTPATDGTICLTESERAKGAQAGTLEDLLLNHPLDCPVCDKAGECTLQDYSYRYGHSHSRMVDDKRTPPNKPYIGDNVTLFTDRCIMCSRCVRFTREVSGEAELQVIDRGHHAEIDIFPGNPLDNKLASNVVDLCPVGALCSKDFLYKHRVWNLKTVNSVCADCSTGCSIHLDANKDIIYRLTPRTNLQAQGYFICEDGRLGYHYANSPERISTPTVKDGESDPVERTWEEVLPKIRTLIEEAEGGSIVAMLSPFLTCEEAFLLAKYLKEISGEIRLYLGPVPIVGEDDTYPKDRRGNPSETVKFTIRAEKCPNRRGVEEVLQHFQGEVIGFEDLVRSAEAGEIKVAYLAGGYPPRPNGWVNEEQATSLSKVETLIVQDLLPSPVSEKANYLLPASSWAEKDGAFVNYAGLVQAIIKNCTPLGDARSDGQVFFELMERRGLYHAPTLRREMASEIAFFAPMAEGDLGEFGIHLEPR